jgi:hypothetical protein
MAANPYDQFDAPAAANPYDQFDRTLKSVSVTPEKPLSWGEVGTQAIQNLGPSAKNLATGLGTAVMHPIDTTGSLLNLGAGALQNILPEQLVNFVNQVDANNPKAIQAAKRATDTANAVGGFYAQRYGTIDGLKRAIAQDPVGVAADFSTLLTGGAGAVGKIGKVAESANLPMVAKPANIGANALRTAANVTNPINALVAPATGVVRMFGPTKAELAKTKAQNIVRDTTLNEAQKLGYITSPGSVTGSGKNIVAERMAGKTSLEQHMSVANQAITDKIARAELALPDTAPLTEATMKAIRAEEYAKGYEPINRIGKIKTDANYTTDLNNLKNEFTGASKSFPEAVPDEVGKLIKNYTKSEFNTADAIKVSSNLRSQASANFRKGETALAKTQLGITEAIENQIERTLANTGNAADAQLLKQFKDSRKRMAVSHTIEEAIHTGAGRVDLKDLAKELRKGKYLSGELKTAAEFANTFPRVSQSPSSFGTAGAQTMVGNNSLASGVGAGIGALLGFGNEGGYAGATTGFLVGQQLGAQAPAMTAAAMRKYLQSNRVQQNMLPSYAQRSLASDVAMRNAILAAQAGKIKDINQNALAQ